MTPCHVSFWWGRPKVVPYGPVLAKALEAARHRVDAVFLLHKRPGAAAPLVAGCDLDWEADAREGRAVDAHHL